VGKLMERESKMADSFVILGTVALVGLVAVTTIALVYNRTLWVSGSDKHVEIRTAESTNKPTR
jgi:hypothetical protein